MPGHVHQNLPCKKAWCLFGCKKSASLFLLSRDITKILQPFFSFFVAVIVVVVVDGGGTLSISGYSHQKQWYYFVEDFDIYLPAKIIIIPPFFLEILQRYCELVILGTLGISDQAHQKQ